jgi:NADH-quinone oxidoreductase subunit M
MILTILILIPLLGAVVTALMPTGLLAKQVGMAVSLATLGVGVLVATQYSLGDGMQLTETYAWIEPLGVHYALGVDGLGLLMVLLTVGLVPLVLGASWSESDAAGNSGGKAFFAWTLALEALSLAVFTATDVLFFYLVFEATLIPAYFLVGGWGKEGRGRAATKFLIYQLAGGLVMLVSVIGLYVVSADNGKPTFLISELAALDIDGTAGKWIFVGFFIAFAIKAPMFPVHTWLADTTEKATPPTSVLLVSILDKIGTFGMLRFCLGLVPEASQWATPVVIVLALISIIYGAWVAIGQDDVLRLIGLTSVSHFGFIVLGIFVFNSTGAAGSILYMVNHGIATTLMFLVAGFLIHRTGTASIREMAGVEKSAPVLAGIFLIGGLAAAGLPGLAPFVSELMVIISAFQYHWVVGAFAVTGIVLAAVYALWMYQRIMTGPGRAEAPVVSDLRRGEVGVLAPLVLALLLLGFYPAPALDVINPNVSDTLVHVGVSEPAPAVNGVINEGGQP